MISAIAAVLLTACASGSADIGGSETDPQTGTPEQQGTGAPAPEAERIVVYGSTGVFEETMNDTIIPAFTEQTGIEVIYQGVHSADVLTRVLGQGEQQEASLVMLNDLDAAVGGNQDLWQEVDASLLPELEAMPDQVLGDDGTTVSVSIGAWGIAYNPVALEAAGVPVPTSWEDLFDDQYANRSLVFDFTIGPGPYVVWALDRAVGPGPDDYGHILEFVRENRDNVLAFPTQVTEWDQLIEQGAAWIGLTSNARAAILQTAGVDVDFAYPEEGAPAFEIRAAVPRGAPDAVAGTMFLNYLLEPEQQVLQGEALYYSPVHPDAQLPSAIAGLTPQEHLDDVVFAPSDELLRIRDDVIPELSRVVEGG